jgi:uncharacterized protein YggU (UPF0235/DUF167 family)
MVTANPFAQLMVLGNSNKKLSRWKGQRLVLHCIVLANEINEFVRQHGDRIKFRIAAEPIEGKADAVPLKFLA